MHLGRYPGGDYALSAPAVCGGPYGTVRNMGASHTRSAAAPPPAAGGPLLRLGTLKWQAERSIFPGMRAASDRPQQALAGGSSMWGPEWLTVAEVSLLTGARAEAISDLVAEGRLHPSGTRGATTTLVRTAELQAAMVTAPANGVGSPIEAGAARDEPGSIRGRRSPVQRVSEIVLLLVAAGLIARALFVTQDARPSRSQFDAPRAAQQTIPPSAPPRDSGAAGVPGSPIPPAFNTPLFVQEGRWVTAATMVTNPNTRWWLRSTSLTFLVRDRRGRDLARRSTTVSIPPGSSVRAIAPVMRLRPNAASASSVLLYVTPARWENAKRFVPPGLRLEGAAVSGSPDGQVAVVASLSNETSKLGSGDLVCVTTNAAGGLTGAVGVVISFPAHQQGSVSIPVPRPASGSLAADCQIAPDSR
jgi:hypothetical protein